MAEFANWQWVDLEETSSTNDEVKRLCTAAPSGKRFMVAARRQNAVAAAGAGAGSVLKAICLFLSDWKSHRSFWDR